MKTNLPESRNRNLPPPEAAAPVQPPRRPPHLPAREPRQGPSFLRSIVVMLIIGGVFATGIFFYIRHAETDAKIGDDIEEALSAAGRNIWAVGRADAFFADTDETQKDLDDLPRVVMAVRDKVKSANPSITVAEGDPPLFKGSHQIVYRVNKEVVFVVRVEYQKATEQFKFLGERNGISASRKDQRDPATPGLPPLPSGNPADPVLPPEGSAVPPPVPVPPPPPATPAPGEKVSEQP